MKKLYVFCWLFLLIGTANSFSQIRWDSLEPITTSAVLYSEGPNVMYADSNYLYMAGEFTVVGKEHIQGIARWDGVKWDSMGTGIEGKYYLTRSQYPANTYAMVTYHNKLYVGGEFGYLGDISAHGIGTWNGTAWDSLPVQPFIIDTTYQLSEGFVYALAVINDKLYMGGGFDSAAGKRCSGIACWNDTSWSSLNFPNGFSFRSINAICEYQGSIYVGGSFAGQNGGIGEIMRYDSAGWHGVDTGIKGAADWIESMVVYNGELYVAGYFFKSEGNAGNCIQKWDGTQWSDVGGGVDGEVWNLMVYHSKLYAMGEIGHAGGIPASSIAEWDGSKWCSLGGTFGNGILTSCTYKDSLYVGGGFRTIDGDSIIHIAEWTGGDYTSNCSQPTGINEVIGESEEVKVYPNPSNGQFTLSLSNVNTVCNLGIYNVLGAKVYTEVLAQSQSNNTINLIGQPNGVYLYRVISENGDLVGEGKIIVQK